MRGEIGAIDMETTLAPIAKFEATCTRPRDYDNGLKA